MGKFEQQVITCTSGSCIGQLSALEQVLNKGNTAEGGWTI